MKKENLCSGKGFLCLLITLALAAVLLSGCSSSSGGDFYEGRRTGTYQVYYVSPEGDRLVHTGFKPDSGSFEGILKEMLSAFCSPSRSGYVSALPDSVKINSSTIGISEIDVDFGTEYLSLASQQELLLRAALVETLVQLPGVDRVRFTVEGQPLSLNGSEVGPMTHDTFIVPDRGAINSYRNREIPLYFSNQTGDGLVRENRRIYYSSNINTERIVAEQIISGPNNDTLLPVTESSVIVLGARVRGSTCLIDFSSAVNDPPAADSPVQPETALYAFVNAICDACGDEGITGVRFTIEGQSDRRFRGQVNLDQTFTENDEIVDQSGTDSEEVGVLVDEDGKEDGDQAPATEKGL